MNNVIYENKTVYFFKVSFVNSIQDGFDDKFTNILASKINTHINKDNIEIDKYVYFFEPIHIDNDCYICKFCNGPSKNNPKVKNYTYGTMDETEKTEVSVFNTLFYIDFNTKLCFYLTYSGCPSKGKFKKCFEKKLKSHDITLEKCYYANWKEILTNKIKNITNIEVKELHHEDYPSVRSKLLKNDNLIYSSTKYKVKIKSKQFIEQFEIGTMNQQFERFIVTADGEEYDYLDGEILIKNEKEFPLEYLETPENYKNELIAFFKDYNSDVVSAFQIAFK